MVYPQVCKHAGQPLCANTSVHSGNNRLTIVELLMQQSTAKACIPAIAPYLRSLLKLDNLPPIYKHLSEQVLHTQISVGVQP